MIRWCVSIRRPSDHEPSSARKPPAHGRDVTLWTTDLFAVLAVLVIAWRRMWVSVPLIFWALAAFVTLAQQQPLWEEHVVLLSSGARVDKWMWCLCRVAGFLGARQAAR